MAVTLSSFRPPPVGDELGDKSCPKHGDEIMGQRRRKGDALKKEGTANPCSTLMRGMCARWRVEAHWAVFRNLYLHYSYSLTLVSSSTITLLLPLHMYGHPERLNLTISTWNAPPKNASRSVWERSAV